MDVISAVIYGIIQGITEFFPISSSGHLALLPHFLKINDPGVVFDLMMHVGTALAIVVYFRATLLNMLKKLVSTMVYWVSFKNRKSQNRTEDPFVRNYLNTCVATFCLVLVLKPLALSYGRNNLWIALNGMVFGLIMFLADWKGANHDGPNNQLSGEISWKKSVLIGLAQSLAIFPGVSRSGITITMGRGLGLSRVEATEYSFLLSLPLIFAGAILKGGELSAQYMMNEAPIAWTGVVSALVGVCVSFFVGLLAIHYFLKWVRKVGLFYFFAYRLVLGIIIIFIFA